MRGLGIFVYFSGLLGMAGAVVPSDLSLLEKILCIVWWPLFVAAWVGEQIVLLGF
jgi:hypothetical protein